MRKNTPFFLGATGLERALIIGAGPFFNFFLAAALFSSVNLIAGIPSFLRFPLRWKK